MILFLNFLASIIEDILGVISLIAFWYGIFLFSKDFFGLSFSQIMRFLLFFYIVSRLTIKASSFSSGLIHSLRSGTFSLNLTYPTSPFLFEASHYPIRLGEAASILILFFLNILLGNFDSSLIIGILLSFFFSLYLSLLIVSLSLLFNSTEIGHDFRSFLSLLGQMPTTIYKGILFVLANIVFPAFLLGSFQFLFPFGYGKIIRYWTIFTLLTFPLVLLFFLQAWKRTLKKYEGYGL